MSVFLTWGSLVLFSRAYYVPEYFSDVHMGCSFCMAYERAYCCFHACFQEVIQGIPKMMCNAVLTAEQKMS